MLVTAIIISLCSLYLIHLLLWLMSGYKEKYKHAFFNMFYWPHMWIMKHMDCDDDEISTDEILQPLPFDRSKGGPLCVWGRTSIKHGDDEN